MSQFIHLHNHSHYSLLDGACRIADLVKAATNYNMPSLALTDHGTMFGAIEFYSKCQKAGIKPIVGVEAYMAPRSRKDKSSQKSGGSDTAFHIVLLAKDKAGYQNLMRLVSIGYLEGFYYRPRIDKEVLKKYHEGIIVLSACLKGEIAQAFIHGRDEEAKRTALEYREIFGDDYYLEIHNHGIPEELEVVEKVSQLSADLSIPLVATNDTHYLKREHSLPHDCLICLQTGKDRDDPNRLRYSTDQIYFKSPDEMSTTFPQHPEALTVTNEIAAKCDLKLDFDQVYLPTYELPQEHQEKDLDEYLKLISYEGLKDRYDEITPELEKRLLYELDVIQKTGYAGYFLIVQDFTGTARARGIPVGPGRGSAAGSLVSYCIGITNIDPIKYGLIFERFLNPERVTMPDIDIDFCFERREEIIDYVRQKYGEQNVTQIITFGTMAARAVIRDVGRVLKLRYSDVDKIAKMIPATIGITLQKALELVPELNDLIESSETTKQLFEYSQVLEGLARHASTHAAGVVITPDALTNYTPLYKSNTGDITTQYDMKCLEQMGVLKMDFLGLRTLTVIDKCLKMLRQRNIIIDIDDIPLDDKKTYELFGNGETISVFQFESSGMREYLKKLKPQSIDDLIAMNSLYRPGPMDMIDDFIARKHGRQKIEYLHPKLEPILEETYGIIVYQEQVMKIASELAGFTLGGADMLRRAMGKKILALMKEQRKEFVRGAGERGISEKVANQIFDLMDKFASYGFNKSHAACYSVVAYQTAYLKSHYPAEYMAATMTSEMNNTARIVILMDECKRMGVEVISPNINKGFVDFVVEDGKVLYGLGAIKNVGRGAIEAIVKAREQEGDFKSIFDFTSRVDMRYVNKKVMESLVQAGAFDCISENRHQLFAGLEAANAFSQRRKNDRNRQQVSIFDNATEEIEDEPELPKTPEWSSSERLKREKDVLGLFLSGHPLDRYAFEVSQFSKHKIKDLVGMRDGVQVMVCGLVTTVKTILDRKGNQMAFITIEDFIASTEIIVFSDVLNAHRESLQEDAAIVVKGTTSSREDEPAKILVEKIYTIDEAWQNVPSAIMVDIQADRLNDLAMDRVLQSLRINRGDCSLYFRVHSEKLPDYEFQSKTMSVRPNAELIRTLQQTIGNDAVKIEVTLPNGNNGRNQGPQRWGRGRQKNGHGHG